MDKLLNVTRVGLGKNLNDDMRSPESFAFPACLTSLMECVGEDARWETIRAHNRDYTQRFLNKQILAATGMSFGLLWSPTICPSSFDLMQVNDHAETIRLGFDYVGYDCEIISPEVGVAELRGLLVKSIDAGKPVLGFGIAGDPECRILCGYEDGGKYVLGYGFFPGDRQDVQTLENGMFRLGDWEKDVWTLVICGKKKQAETAPHLILERGVHIMEQSNIDGYLAGGAVYDAWAAYVTDDAYTNMDDQPLRGRYWFHYTLTGNHAEARAYLGGFLMSVANGNEHLVRAAGCMNDIHSACWQLWGVAGGVSAKDGYLCLRDKAKRDELAQIIGEIRVLDNEGKDAMKQWLMRS